MSGLLLLALGCFQWNLTTSFTFARVLAGTTIVATLATALPLALVHSLAIVLCDRGAATLALTRVLAGASILGGGTGSLPFAFIVPLANVLSSLVVGRQNFTSTSR
jgi:hypothetical protein